MPEKIPRVEKERSQFTALLASNPNYFGNLPKSRFKPVKKIIASQRFEALTCVGFNPKLELLEATIEIKLPYGYKGGLCKAGSYEYVRFFLSHDEGVSWEDAGLAAVNVHDIPNSDDCADRPTKPLVFVLTQEISPRHVLCRRPHLPLVRAILSWEDVPPDDDPGWLPVWGNRLERHIQIPKREIFLGDLPQFFDADVKLPPEFQALEEEPIPLPEPPDPSIGQLAKLYPKTTKAKKGAPSDVGPERFGSSDLQAVLGPGAMGTQLLAAKMADWQQAGLDWTAAVEAYVALGGNVSYEELECLGLDYNREHLGATFRIKRPFGYAGGLCSRGSTEYVAFWADWDDTCEWTYLGTAEVKAYDFASIPADGLAYTAILKADLDAKRRPCSEPQIGRIRAVLSWNTPPSTVDPDDLPRWGNRLETHVLIRPGEPGAGGKITIIGGVGIGDIHVGTTGLTKTDARFALQGTLVDQHGRNCPFGQRVVINGPPLAGRRYRVRARPLGTPPGRILDKRIWIVNEDGVGSWFYPGADGYFGYLGHDLNFFGTLAYFDTHRDDDGVWEVRLEVQGEFPGPWHRVRLDNTQPTAEITLTGGACNQFVQGDPLAGTFVARDPYFGRYSLEVLPSTLPSGDHPNPTSPSSGTSQTSLSGDSWSLDTSAPLAMPPCGYVIRLHVRDRSILNSAPNNHNYRRADVGWCLIEA